MTFVSSAGRVHEAPWNGHFGVNDETQRMMEHLSDRMGHSVTVTWTHLVPRLSVGQWRCWRGLDRTSASLSDREQLSHWKQRSAQPF